MCDDAGRLLLVRRAHPPAEGTWSLPGGRVEPGEDEVDACRREVLEETALEVVVGSLVGTVELEGLDRVTYLIRDYSCRVTGGRLRAGDDSADARWVSIEELGSLDCAPGLVEALTTWGVVSR